MQSHSLDTRKCHIRLKILFAHVTVVIFVRALCQTGVAVSH